MRWGCALQALLDDSGYLDGSVSAMTKRRAVTRQGGLDRQCIIMMDKLRQDCHDDQHHDGPWTGRHRQSAYELSEHCPSAALSEARQKSSPTALLKNAALPTCVPRRGFTRSHPVLQGGSLANDSFVCVPVILEQQHKEYEYSFSIQIQKVRQI